MIDRRHASGPEYIPPQELYNQMLILLGEPSINGIPYPLPDFVVRGNTVVPSVHSPRLQIIDQEAIGVGYLSFGTHEGPAGTGRGNMVVMAKRPMHLFEKQAFITVEGNVRFYFGRKDSKGDVYTRSFALCPDGATEITERRVLWTSEAHAYGYWSRHHDWKHWEAPNGMWQKVYHALAVQPLLPAERLEQVTPPKSQPFRFHNPHDND